MKAKYTASQKNDYSKGHSHSDSHDNQQHSHDNSLHSHTHSHSHSHDEVHDHQHQDEKTAGEMSKDEKTLRVLLVHWVDHNKSHQESFNEWIEKSKLMDKEKTAEYIQKAVEYMEKANEMLVEAKKNI